MMAPMRSVDRWKGASLFNEALSEILSTSQTDVSKTIHDVLSPPAPGIQSGLSAWLRRDRQNAHQMALFSPPCVESMYQTKSIFTSIVPTSPTGRVNRFHVAISISLPFSCK